MPLLELPAHEAMQARKGNAYSDWGDRSSANRIEPITMPSFSVPFRLEHGENIFTIGSCFARNVETELTRRGFRVPMRDLFASPEFAGLDVGIVNNYGTPSIYNEIAWAFGAEPFAHADHIVEVVRGKFADLHLSPTMRPEARDTVVGRRDAVLRATRSAGTCRVVIMTLGLIECWFDTHTGYYLNVAPRPSLLKTEPDRFQFRVLSYAETLGFLNRAIDILRDAIGDHLRVVLTVSPVPLTVTHRDMDVVVANAYSKSVLRAVVDEAASTRPYVSYYPSYESIVTTDRRIAFREDFRHVTDQMIRLNVSRMVEAFVGDDRPVEEVVREFDEGGEPMALERARTFRNRGGVSADSFFAQTTIWSARSVLFAMECAEHMLNAGRPADARDVLLPHLDANLADIAFVTLVARAKIEAGESEEAVSLLEGIAAEGSRAVTLWNALLDAAVATKRESVVRAALSRISRNAKTNRPAAYLKVARFFREMGSAVDAEIFLKEAWSDGLGSSVAAFELTEALVEWHRSDEARVILASIPLNTDYNRKKHALIAPLVGVRVNA